MSKGFKISLARLGCIFGQHSYGAKPDTEYLGVENGFAVYVMIDTCVFCGKKRKTKLLFPEGN